jgi:hypothetical protein
MGNRKREIERDRESDKVMGMRGMEEVMMEWETGREREKDVESQIKGWSWEGDGRGWDGMENRKREKKR